MKRLIVTALVGLAGCKASAGAKVNSAGDADGHASISGSERESESDTGPADGSAADVPDLEPGGGLALLGARHDLFLDQSASAHRCRCLEVAAGQPGDPQFYWESVVPRIDARLQLVVAFSSRGQVCEDEPADSVGASYHGYEKRGPDVVVMVEASRAGRPQVGGAILPRPEPGGRVLIQPVPTRLPYGKPLRGSGEKCEVPAEARAPAGSDTDVAIVTGPEPDDVTAFEEAQAESLGDDPNHPSDDSDELERRRTGLYLGTILGPGWFLLDDDQPGNPQIHGFGFSFDLLLGGSPARDFALGGLIGAGIVPGPRYESDGQQAIANDVNLNVFHIGVFADYYLMEDANLHLMGFVGYENASFSGRDTVIDQAEAGGVGMSLGVGYDFWIANRWSIGLLGRFGYGFLDASGASLNSMTPVLGATITFH